ncbi:hypothetical protein Pelo_1152 [Pelomyxa schiedti]|nr:hypothetical protein Pelo_1152 [Pelomyxa schiedti]
MGTYSRCRCVVRLLWEGEPALFPNSAQFTFTENISNLIGFVLPLVFVPMVASSTALYLIIRGTQQYTQGSEVHLREFLE